MHDHGSAVHGAHETISHDGSDPPPELQDRVREGTCVWMPLGIVKL